MGIPKYIFPRINYMEYGILNRDFHLNKSSRIEELSYIINLSFLSDWKFYQLFGTEM
jgi:hypothetical protein